VSAEPAQESPPAPQAARIVEDLCKHFEGFRARPYLCPANVWTIGYGATVYLDGRAVQPGDGPVSPEVAERLLERQISGIYLPGALRLCPTADTPGRQAALADFAFNLGLTRLKASTLRRRVLAQDWQGAATELGKWVRGGARVLPGLVARRAAEAALLE
jgi:lysozyme